MRKIIIGTSQVLALYTSSKFKSRKLRELYKKGQYKIQNVLNIDDMDLVLHISVQGSR